MQIIVGITNNKAFVCSAPPGIMIIEKYVITPTSNASAISGFAIFTSHANLLLNIIC